MADNFVDNIRSSQFRANITRIYWIMTIPPAIWVFSLLKIFTVFLVVYSYSKIDAHLNPKLINLRAQSAVNKMSILLLWNIKWFFISPFCHKSDYIYLHVLQHWYSNEIFPFQNFALRLFRKPVQIFSCLISAWQTPFFFHHAYHHYLWSLQNLLTDPF